MNCSTTTRRRENYAYNIHAVSVEKRCTKCGKLLYKKVSIASGEIEIDCPRCGKKNVINLAYRRSVLR